VNHLKACLLERAADGLAAGETDRSFRTGPAHQNKHLEPLFAAVGREASLEVLSSLGARAALAGVGLWAPPGRLNVRILHDTLLTL